MNPCYTCCIFFANMCNLTFLFESVCIGKQSFNTAYSSLFTSIINQRASKARVNAQTTARQFLYHNGIKRIYGGYFIKEGFINSA